ncbi:MAG: DUF2085 domain-containing protein [Oscillospiraceae bacterium]|nr:DUF2085 domain-containing protein [Oscillospiraceae bacterium]MBQ8378965.1 DUF2085 domain-containing protein [Oscillospiraceae bacterium]MBQ8884307.1 DUF2085 domain-containing protein [Oscillospiraceae bacterium]
MQNKHWILLMRLGDIIGCHQLPERSFFINKYQFPVCARCTGVIISSIIALFVFIRYKTPFITCFFMSYVMFMDWFIQYLQIKESTNVRRFITGLIGGFGYSTLQFYFYEYIFKKINPKKN